MNIFVQKLKSYRENIQPKCLIFRHDLKTSENCDFSKRMSWKCLEYVKAKLQLQMDKLSKIKKSSKIRNEWKTLILFLRNFWLLLPNSYFWRVIFSNISKYFVRQLVWQLVQKVCYNFIKSRFTLAVNQTCTVTQ